MAACRTERLSSLDCCLGLAFGGKAPRAVLLETNDEWQLQHRYMQTEVMAELIPPQIETITPQIATLAA